LLIKVAQKHKVGVRFDTQYIHSGTRCTAGCSELFNADVIKKSRLFIVTECH